MNKEVADFMVFIVEQVANRFFAGDQAAAYITMKDSGLWDFFSDTYDVSHSLGVEYLMDDAEKWLKKRGVEIA
jgi:hypothetical protein